MRPEVREALGITPEYLDHETNVQKEAITNRRGLYRAIRPEAEIAGRRPLMVPLA